MKKIYVMFYAILITFSAQASSPRVGVEKQKVAKQRREITLVDAIQRYEKILKIASQAIQDAQETQDVDFLAEAKEELIRAKRYLDIIGKKVEQGISDEEWREFVIYSAQNLNGVSLDRLLYVLHDKREALKKPYKELEAKLGKPQKENKKSVEQIVVMYPEKKAKKPEEKRSVSFHNKVRLRPLYEINDEGEEE